MLRSVRSVMVLTLAFTVMLTATNAPTQAP
jgi:hypothetical protein